MSAMKTATYTSLDGATFTVEYDPEAPCISCGEPVVAASMGGTAVCPWCDCGTCRYCDKQVLRPQSHVPKCKSWLMSGRAIEGGER